jgi:hypothetical protein
MKVRLTLVAAALSMAFGVAYANDPVDPALITNKTNIENDIKVKGEVYVGGKIAVSAESSAVTDNSQDTTRNLSGNLNHSGNTASVGDAGKNAKGNIGMNAASGSGNAQSNQTAISSVDARDVFASAQNFNTQKTISNWSVSVQHSPNQATVDSGALANAQGNIGVNVAAGAGNAQGNATSMAIGTSGVIAKATSTSKQETAGNVSLNAALCDTSPNTALIGGGALSGATGNIGVNVAAGAGNAQYNSLAMSTAGSAIK